MMRFSLECLFHVFSNMKASYWTKFFRSSLVLISDEFKLDTSLVIDVIKSFSSLLSLLIDLILYVTNFIRSYLHQFFDDSHGLKASLKPLRRPFDRYQSCLEEINNGRDIRQIN